MALHQLAQQQALPAERGEITDVNGELLATSVELQSVFAIPPTIERSRRCAAALLASVLDMPAAEAARPARQRSTPGSGCKRRVDAGGGGTDPSARHPRRRHAARDEARLPGRGRRRRDDDRRAAHRLRRRRRRRAVRRRGRPRTRCWPGTPGRGDRAGGRHRPPDRRLGRRCCASRSMAQTCASPSTPASSTCSSRRCGTPSSKNSAAGVTGHDHERRDGRDPRHGQLPVVRREPVRDDRWRAVREPGGRAPVRAGLGDEGVHHRRGARRRAPSRPARHVRRRQQPAHRPASASRMPTATTIRTATGRSPPADVLAALEQRRRREDRPRRWAASELYEAFLPLRLRRADRHRAGRRGHRAWSGTRTGRTPRAT